MADKRSLTIIAWLALMAPASAQTPPPSPGSVLANPEAPRPIQPVNPSGAPPLPSIIPPSILMPGSGR